MLKFEVFFFLIQSMIMSKQVSLLHYLPLDLIHKVTDLMFDRQHYCMLNTTCKAYNNLKKALYDNDETTLLEMERTLSSDYTYNFTI